MRGAPCRGSTSLGSMIRIFCGIAGSRLRRISVIVGHRGRAPPILHGSRAVRAPASLPPASPGVTREASREHVAAGARQRVAAREHPQRRQRLQLADSGVKAAAALGRGAASCARPIARARARSSARGHSRAAARRGCSAATPLAQLVDGAPPPAQPEPRRRGRLVQLGVEALPRLGQLAPPRAQQARPQLLDAGARLGVAAAPPAPPPATAWPRAGRRRSRRCVKSTSWPTALTTGTRQAAMARASPSSLKACRSSDDPPPRADDDDVDVGLALERPQREDHRQPAPFALHLAGRDQDLHAAAPLGDADDVAHRRPRRRGHDADAPRPQGSGRLRAASNSPSSAASA